MEGVRQPIHEHARIQEFSSGGVQVRLTKKALTRFFFFFFFFLVLSLFDGSQMVNFKEIYHFSRSQRGSNIFQGVQLFPGGGGSNCLFPIETHITCDFPGGGGSGPPVPPLDPHLMNNFIEQTNTGICSPLFQCTPS